MPDRLVNLKVVPDTITIESQIDELKFALVKLVPVMFAPLSSAPLKSAFEKLMLDRS